MRMSARSAAAAVVAVLLTLGGGLASAPAQAAPADPIGVTTGTSWLKKQLTDGVVHNRQYQFDDYGLSIDIAFALDAIGGQTQTVQSISDALAAHIASYDSAPTAAAKAAVLADLAGADADNYGGKHLVTEVSDAISTSTGTEGRLLGATDPDNDYANTLTQAYAVNALVHASNLKASSATQFLLDQQCPGGGFRQDFSARAAAEQSCTDDSQAGIDPTAVAVLQLEASGSNAPGVATALTQARTCLADRQAADGSWGGGTGTSASNANSTGLAAWALGASDRSTKAARWLRLRQATSYDRCDALWPSLGAVSYDTSALHAGRTDGVTVQSEDQFRRATAQALPALQYLAPDPNPSAPVVTGPSGYQKAGAQVQIATSGVKTHDQLCLYGPGAHQQALATGSTWNRTITLPAGTATRTYSVRDAYGHSDDAAVKVLGRKTLPVTLSATRAHRGHTVTATVSGLAPNEISAVYLASSRVGYGRADDNGVFRASFSVGSATGSKTVTGYGRYTDIRRGTAGLTVVR